MEPKPAIRRRAGMLTEPRPAEARQAMRLWSRTAAGSHGERGGMPEEPDDPVAYQLLDAAGHAYGRGDRQRSVRIIELVARDYPESKEAAFARSLLDKLAGRQRGR